MASKKTFFNFYSSAQDVGIRIMRFQTRHKTLSAQSKGGPFGLTPHIMKRLQLRFSEWQRGDLYITARLIWINPYARTRYPRVVNSP